MAASGSSDALTLRMLSQTLMPSQFSLVNVEGAGSPMLLADRVAEVSPAIVILSHLPPEALGGRATRSGGSDRGFQGCRSL